MQTDMTVGKPMKMLLNFTIPVFLGNVFQQLYSMADAVICLESFCWNQGAGSGRRYWNHYVPYLFGFLMGLQQELQFLPLRSSEQEEWMRCVRRLVMQQFFLL